MLGFCLGFPQSQWPGMVNRGPPFSGAAALFSYGFPLVFLKYCLVFLQSQWPGMENRGPPFSVARALFSTGFP